MPQKGAAEGTEDLVHKGRVCRLGFRLSADGGLQLPAHRQRPDLVDREDGVQVGRCQRLRRSLVLRDGLQPNNHQGGRRTAKPDRASRRDR